MTIHPRQIDLPDLAATEALAQRIAPRLAPGDTLLLSGEIGAGKSAFSRALIRARLGRMEDVPSPTFTLVQTYEDPAGDIWHADLYRLGDVDEVFELGLDAAFEEAICLVEWPERLGAYAPDDALRLFFAAGEEGHSVTLTAPGRWSDLLDGVEADHD